MTTYKILPQLGSKWYCYASSHWPAMQTWTLYRVEIGRLITSELSWRHCAVKIHLLSLAKSLSVSGDWWVTSSISCPWLSAPTSMDTLTQTAHASPETTLPTVGEGYKLWKVLQRDNSFSLSISTVERIVNKLLKLHCIKPVSSTMAEWNPSSGRVFTHHSKR